MRESEEEKKKEAEEMIRAGVGNYGIVNKVGLAMTQVSAIRRAIEEPDFQTSGNKRIEKERFRGHPSDDCHTFDQGTKKEMTKREGATAQEVVRNVREGIRSKRDLRNCGCSVCQEALRILGASR